MDGRATVILDTSTLINFLAVDRVDLLARHPDLRFIVTEHARAEVKGHYPDQLQRLEAALAAGHLEESSVDDMRELDVFARLLADGRLGAGECASIAAAAVRGIAVALDDKSAMKRARAFDRRLTIMNTQTLVVSCIHAGLLSVADADAIKAEWAAKHRFTIKITSFGDVL